MSRRNIHVWLTCKNITRRTVAGLSASSDTVTIINGILFQLESNKWNGIFENMTNISKTLNNAMDLKTVCFSAGRRRNRWKLCVRPRSECGLHSSLLRISGLNFLINE